MASVQEPTSEIVPGDVSTPDDRAVVASLAQRFLPAGVRERWLALGRPAVQLLPASTGDAWVARLGGLPHLPDGQPWPEWAGHGPLSYIAEIDCSRLLAFEPVMPLPATGRLLFFYFDGSYDNHFASTVGYWDPASAPGAQTLFLPDADHCREQQAPPGVTVYPQAHLAGRSILTFPGWEHPDLQAEFMTPGQSVRELMDHPVCTDDFQEAMRERHSGPLHQIGGYAAPVQGPVEAEIAQAVLGPLPWDSQDAMTEAARWELVLQVESDDSLDMMWGDCGTLYWLARPEDVTRGDLSKIQFTWQCG